MPLSFEFEKLGGSAFDLSRSYQGGPSLKFVPLGRMFRTGQFTPAVGSPVPLSRIRQAGYSVVNVHGKPAGAGCQSENVPILSLSGSCNPFVIRRLCSVHTHENEHRDQHDEEQDIKRIEHLPRRLVRGVRRFAGH